MSFLLAIFSPIGDLPISFVRSFFKDAIEHELVLLCYMIYAYYWWFVGVHWPRQIEYRLQSSIYILHVKLLMTRAHACSNCNVLLIAWLPHFESYGSCGSLCHSRMLLDFMFIEQELFQYLFSGGCLLNFLNC